MNKNDSDACKVLESNEIVDEMLLDEMGISRPVYEEVMSIVGHLPTVDELSTLVEMWRSQTASRLSGMPQLLDWLKGQFHAVERHDYLEDDLEPESRQYREPEVRECIEIAHKLFENNKVSRSGERRAENGDAIYMVGDVSSFFTNSDYGRRYLHLVDNPMIMDDNEETAHYMELILGSMEANGALSGYRRVGDGGLFRTLMGIVAPQRMGFDILTCREVRLDAFLFGEKGVRFVTVIDEPREDFFLQKLVEARINCCFLGRITRDRVIVDGVDFGRSSAYCTK